MCGAGEITLFWIWLFYTVKIKFHENVSKSIVQGTTENSELQIFMTTNRAENVKCVSIFNLIPRSCWKNQFRSLPSGPNDCSRIFNGTQSTAIMNINWIIIISCGGFFSFCLLFTEASIVLNVTQQSFGIPISRWIYFFLFLFVVFSPGCFVKKIDQSGGLRCLQGPNGIILFLSDLMKFHNKLPNRIGWGNCWK